MVKEKKGKSINLDKTLLVWYTLSLLKIERAEWMIYIGKANALVFVLLIITTKCFAFDEVITVPAEDPAGVLVGLPSGKYVAQIESGAVALHFPIHPNFCWVYTVSIGRDVDGGQDEANIGMLFVEPQAKAMTQTEAESYALKAFEEGKEGTKIIFALTEYSKVRLWVSDYDYSDNSGSEKIKIYSYQE